MKRLATEHWRIAAALAAIFLGGQVFGYVLATRDRERPPAAVEPAVPDPGTADDPTEWTGAVVARLSDELALRPEQAAAIEPLVQSTALKVARQRQRTLFQIHLQLLELHDELDPLLDSDQQDRLRLARKELETTIRERFAPLLDESAGIDILE